MHWEGYLKLILMKSKRKLKIHMLRLRQIKVISLITLDEIYLPRVCIGDLGAKIFAYGIANSSELTSLTLGSIWIKHRIL